MDIESFCKMIWGKTYDEINDMISYKDYKQFSIPKKHGHRIITYLPHTAALFQLQIYLNKKYLIKKKLSPCAKGFVRNESYFSYLEPHINSMYFLRLDIKNFFISITKELITNELSHFITLETKEDSDSAVELVANICTYDNSLPQGAPSSPPLSNIVMIRADQRILKYCQELGVKYSRYADDMFFSSDSIDFKNKKWFLNKIKFILSDFNLNLNYGKIKYGKIEISLSGYVVSNGGIRLSRNRLSDIRHAIAFSRDNAALYKKDKNLFLAKANNLVLKYRNLIIYPFKTCNQFIQYLCGYRSHLISFLSYELDPKFRKEVMKILNKLEKEIIKYY